MTTELITGIRELTTQADDRARLNDAALVIEAGRILWIGPASAAPAADTRTDVGGRAVLPGWVDTHTHLVFAGDRAAEFEARMAGQRYAAGGINTTVAATRAASEEQLARGAARLRREAEAQGTTFLETKTGYGLDLASETRSARAATSVADVVTFLGAHLVPDGIDRRDYLDLVTGPMLAAVAPYADYIDAFCEVGAFDVEESREVLLAGRAAGLGVRVHGNQLGFSGGVRLAVELGAASVDHCNHLKERDIEALAGGATVATLLPACDLSTRQPFPPARRLLGAGARIALATNCNPGTSYTTSMPFCVSTAVLQMGLTIDEAVWAATRGAAAAVGRENGADAAGSLRVGGWADLQVLDAPSVAHLAYRPGVPLTLAVWRRGVRSRLCGLEGSDGLDGSGGSDASGRTDA
ncbi:imidazolonepropionase [Cryobacterium sp. TMT1-21]|uniref:Imidazolonepropionase n=1 Tax=Cryobacterium shii TaxID=1259235 RepID=A0AAQ2C622_9MICO|nr:MULTISPECIES: imidazolonepropionase [Cryobacterium]TFC46609.1 imidazolonepropionase [Cryobacterium shii]TFC89146.1 imidazolonepropionase [Cryobacterium sp. TmT2-59]TFD14101.1 imidazolonepropionase [Cryobacterium sp. TMT4-10]TFD17627.1 imidazolonepropionase [Cryobacterium sp. TMT1-21]TFD22696.1 imidazolonepropionase [Cryobacterium sp. TMT2-23]